MFFLIYNTKVEKIVYAGVMELADVTDSKSVDGDIVWVRVPPPAPKAPHKVAKIRDNRE